MNALNHHNVDGVGPDGNIPNIPKASAEGISRRYGISAVSRGSADSDIATRTSWVENKITELETKTIPNLENKISDNEDQLKSYEDRFNQKLAESSQTVLQTLAIFIGLFTFIAIQFQAFSGSDKTVIVPLILVFVGTLLLFLSVFFVYVGWRRANFAIKFGHILMFASALLLISFGTAIHKDVLNNKTDCALFKENLEKVSIQEVQDNRATLKNIKISCIDN